MKLFALIMTLAPVLTGQTPAPKFTFEVASVKAVDDESANLGNGLHSTGLAPLTGDPIHIAWPSATIMGVVSTAYSIVPRLIDCPDWMRMNRYNITAKVPDDAPKGHIREMLQNLLADRFRLVVRWNSREESGYALTVGKGGLKLKPSTLDEGGVPRRQNAGFGTSGHFTWNGTTLEAFAGSLSAELGKPVVDQTGVAGYFDIAIDAAPDSMPGLPAGFPSHADPGLPSIFTALRELGFNLEPQKVTVKRLVIDSAQKIPTEN